MADELIAQVLGMLGPRVKIATEESNIGLSSFLNQVCAGLCPACDWFLEITFVHNVCMRVCLPPRLLITSGVIWCDIELL